MEALSELAGAALLVLLLEHLLHRHHRPWYTRHEWEAQEEASDVVYTS